MGRKVKIYIYQTNCLKDEELHVEGEESVNGFCLGSNPSDTANLVGFVITREALDVSYYNNNKIIYATTFSASLIIIMLNFGSNETTYFSTHSVVSCHTFTSCQLLCLIILFFHHT